jgi:hypothetical protein
MVKMWNMDLNINAVMSYIFCMILVVQVPFIKKKTTYLHHCENLSETRGFSLHILHLGAH